MRVYDSGEITAGEHWGYGEKIIIDGDIEGYSQSALSPKVIIGHLYEPIVDPDNAENGIEYVEANWPCDPYKNEPVWDHQIISKMIDEQHPFIAPHVEYLKEQMPAGWNEWGDVIDDSGSEDCFYDLSGDMCFRKFNIEEISDDVRVYYPETEDLAINLVHEISLELRYHQGLQRWVVCLIIPSILDFSKAMYFDYPISFSKHRTQSDAPPTLWGYTRDGRYLLIGNNGHEGFVAAVPPNVIEASTVKSGCYVLDGEKAMGYLTKLPDGCDLTNALDIDDNERPKITPALHNTIAAAILKNFAFQDIEQSLPTLMAKDAREKAEQVFGIKAEAQEAYKKGFERWRRDIYAKNILR